MGEIRLKAKLYSWYFKPGGNAALDSSSSSGVLEPFWASYQVGVIYYGIYLKITLHDAQNAMILKTIKKKNPLPKKIVPYTKLLAQQRNSG